MAEGGGVPAGGPPVRGRVAWAGPQPLASASPQAVRSRSAAASRVPVGSATLESALSCVPSGMKL